MQWCAESQLTQLCRGVDILISIDGQCNSLGTSISGQYKHIVCNCLFLLQHLNFDLKVRLAGGGDDEGRVEIYRYGEGEHWTKHTNGLFLPLGWRNQSIRVGLVK